MGKINRNKYSLKKMLLGESCQVLGYSVNSKIAKAIEKLENEQMRIVVNKINSYNSNTLNVVLIDKSRKQVGNIDAIIDNNYLPCNDAYIVRGSFINASLQGTGLGALLYDVAIENSGDAGLTSDRDVVSTDAERMWQYFDRSSDYTSLPFDTPENEFTPDNYADDCDALPYQSYEGLYDDYGSKEQFQDSFFNKSFYKLDKSMATTNCLKEKGLLSFDS